MRITPVWIVPRADISQPPAPKGITHMQPQLINVDECRGVTPSLLECRRHSEWRLWMKRLSNHSKNPLSKHSYTPPVSQTSFRLK